MKKYTIHFWDKKFPVKVVSEEMAAKIFNAKQGGDIFELGGGFFEGSSVSAIVPVKQDLGLVKIEAPKEKPASKEQIEKVTKELRKKGFLRPTSECSQNEPECT